MRVGILGAGFFGNKALQQLISSDDISVVGIASSSHNIEFHPFKVPYFNSYSELLISQRPDCVYICNVLPLHVSSIELALELRMACVCEKPITRNASELDFCIDRAITAGVFLTESMWPLYAIHYSQLMEYLNWGIIGSLISCTVVTSKILDPIIAGRVFDSKLSGGLLYDYSIYGLHFGISMASLGDNLPSSYTVIHADISEKFGSYSLWLGCDFLLSVQYSSSRVLNDFIRVTGTHGEVLISGNLLNPDKIVVENLNQKIEIPVEKSDKFLIPQFKFIAEEIKGGKTESSRVPLAQSRISVKILEELDSNFRA